jgi:hypothetical protein
MIRLGIFASVAVFRCQSEMEGSFNLTRRFFGDWRAKIRKVCFEAWRAFESRRADWQPLYRTGTVVGYALTVPVGYRAVGTVGYFLLYRYSTGRTCRYCYQQ